MAAVRGALLAAATAWHPLHTSVVALVQPTGGPAVEVTVRLFSDDFARATGHPPDRPASITEPEMVAYVRAHLEMVGSDRAVAPLVFMSRRIDGATTELHFTTKVTGGLAGVCLQSHLLTEVYSDQLNLVRATFGGRTETVLFLRTDPPKTLPR
jgi:hypothetical protein